MVALANALFRNAAIQGVVLVLNRVTSQQMEDYLRSALEQRGLRALGVIHADPAIAMAWLTGSKLESERARHEIQVIVNKLEHSVVHYA